jgi:hypothetical protein
VDDTSPQIACFFSDYNFKAGEGDKKGLSLQDFAYGQPDLVRPFLRLSPIISGIPKIRDNNIFMQSTQRFYDIGLEHHK